MTRILLLLIFIFCVKAVSAEPPVRYIIAADIVNLRTQPSLEGEVIKQLSIGTSVNLHSSETKGWYQVISDSDTGYVAASYLTIDLSEWSALNYKSGVQPECYNIVPAYDKSLDNFLRVKVGSNTDVVIKLMKIEEGKDDQCIRAAFIRSKEQFEITNIPEGDYFVKIAYGKDLRKTIYNGKCYIKFLKDAMYEQGRDIIDFRKVKLPDTIEGKYVYENWEVPYYEIELDVLKAFVHGELKTEGIDLEEFNK
jgi:hypothetical protein